MHINMNRTATLTCNGIERIYADGEWFASILPYPYAAAQRAEDIAATWGYAR